MSFSILSCSSLLLIWFLSNLLCIYLKMQLWIQVMETIPSWYPISPNENLLLIAYTSLVEISTKIHTFVGNVSMSVTYGLCWFPFHWRLKLSFALTQITRPFIPRARGLILVKDVVYQFPIASYGMRLERKSYQRERKSVIKMLCLN